MLVINSTMDNDTPTVQRSQEDTDDFPAEATQQEIKEQLALLHEEQRRILVLGLPLSGKSSLIDAILSANHSSPTAQTNWRNYARELRNDMIHSQYKCGDMIVTEWTAQNIKKSAVQNIKYYPILQKPFNDKESARANKRIQVGKVGRRNYKSKMRRIRQVRKQLKVRLYYERLSEYTKKSLRKERKQYSVVRNYKLLCFGYIRQHQAKGISDVNEHSKIPMDVLMLIERYYGSYAVLVDSTKLSVKQYISEFKRYCVPFDILDFWECSQMNVSFSTKDRERGRIDGVILMVDLSSYNEYFVDENGERRNKLEFVYSVWKSVSDLTYINGQRSYTALRMAYLTNRNEFERKLKGNTLTVCPLFSDLDSEEMREYQTCIAAIHEKFQSVYQYRSTQSRGCWSVVIDINNQDEMVNELKKIVRFFEAEEQRMNTGDSDSDDDDIPDLYSHIFGSKEDEDNE